jgi:hypothetical protein
MEMNIIFKLKREEWGGRNEEGGVEKGECPLKNFCMFRGSSARSLLRLPPVLLSCVRQDSPYRPRLPVSVFRAGVKP